MGPTKVFCDKMKDHGVSYHHYPDAVGTSAGRDRAIQIARLSRVLRVAFQSLGGKEEGEGV